MGWQGTGPAYAASYADLCAGTSGPIVAALGAPDGGTLLDVGAGPGDVAALLARAGWAVTACEPEESMRDVARERHPGLRMESGGLPVLPYADDAFDAAVANFVLNHVEDPRASARELGRVSRLVAVATTWVVSPSWFWASVVTRAGLPEAPPARLAPENDFERSVDGFEGMLRDAGWEEGDRRLSVREHSWVWRVRPSALWASVEGGVAGAGARFAGLDDRERRRFRAAFEEIVEEHAEDGMLPLRHTAAVAVTTNAPRTMGETADN
ncbi:class I SAM-dependent methyltransferase [Microbacterium resistens]|uniref:class I SAM-dependent methyltransferase n=1 Tax=Microbacterium resistens TaxID=156977 RepID=UPI00366D0C08